MPSLPGRSQLAGRTASPRRMKSDVCRGWAPVLNDGDRWRMTLQLSRLKRVVADRQRGIDIVGSNNLALQNRQDLFNYSRYLIMNTASFWSTSTGRHTTAWQRGHIVFVHLSVCFSLPNSSEASFPTPPVLSSPPCRLQPSWSPVWLYSDCFQPTSRAYSALASPGGLKQDIMGSLKIAKDGQLWEGWLVR